MQMVISAIAILVFLALTAYDTQTIRETVSRADSTVGDEVSGALSLYLDFIHIFIHLLQLFGIMNKDDWCIFHLETAKYSCRGNQVCWNGCRNATQFRVIF